MSEGWAPREWFAVPTVRFPLRGQHLDQLDLPGVIDRVTGDAQDQVELLGPFRAAALHLSAGGDRVLDVALSAGFDDLSTFNHAFRTEFGAAPLAFRAKTRQAAACDVLNPGTLRHVSGG